MKAALVEYVIGFVNDLVLYATRISTLSLSSYATIISDRASLLKFPAATTKDAKVKQLS